MERKVITLTPLGDNDLLKFSRFEFFQYNGISSDFNNKQGSMANGSLPFFIQFDRNSINTYKANSSTPIGKLYNLFFGNLNSKSRPEVSFDYLKDKFQIAEVDDLGNQSLSEGFLDINMRIFTSDGYKIPNTSVCLLRSYLEKKIYVLVDKNVLLTPALALFDEIENTVTQQEIVLSSISGGIYTISNNEIYGTELVTSGIKDYGLYVKKGTKYYRVSEGYYSMDSQAPITTETSEIINDGTYVNKQGNYFKDLYEAEPISLQSNEQVGIKEFKIRVPFNLSNGETLVLRKESNIYPKLYINSSSIVVGDNLLDADKYEIYGYSSSGGKKLFLGKDYRFDEQGKLVIDSYNYYEVYYINNENRRFDIVFQPNSTNFNVRGFLKYHDHIVNPSFKIEDIIVYKDNLLISSSTLDNLVTSSIYEIIINDRGNTDGTSISNNNYTVKNLYGVQGIAETTISEEIHYITKKLSELNPYISTSNYNFHIPYGIILLDEASSDIILTDKDKFGDNLETNEIYFSREGNNISVQGNNANTENTNLGAIYTTSQTLANTTFGDIRNSSLETSLITKKEILRTQINNSEVDGIFKTNITDLYSNNVYTGFYAIYITSSNDQIFDLNYKDANDIILKKEYGCKMKSYTIDGTTTYEYISFPYIELATKNSSSLPLKISFDNLPSDSTIYLIR